MKLENIIYIIKEELNINSDDRAYDYQDDFIADKIKVKRNELIKQRYSDLRKNLPMDLFQKLCITLELVNEDSGVCIGTILKSSAALPDLMDIGGKYPLYIGKQENRFPININYVDINRLPYVGNNEYIKNQVYVSIAPDNYVYVKSDSVFHKLIKSIEIYAVLEDPLSTNSNVCSASSEGGCTDYSNEYPITEDLISALVKMVKDDLLTKIKYPEDNNNDANGTQPQNKE